MSLINNMLLDLDSRQEKGEEFNNNIVKNIQAVTQPSHYKNHIKTAVFSLAGLVLIIVGWQLYPAQAYQAVEEIFHSTKNNLFTHKESVILTINSATNDTPVVNKHTIKTPGKTQDNSLEIAAPPIIIAAAVQQEESSPKSKTTLSENLLTTENDNARSTPIQATASLRKKQRLPDTQHQAGHQYASALRYLQQGGITKSHALLNKTLQLEPGHIKSRELLSSVLIKQSRWAEAEQLLLDGIALLPEHTYFNHLLARLKIEQGDDNSAISLLEKPDLQGKPNAKSSALLALLYQRQGRHLDASQHYQRALNTQPNQGKWWLGLAISLEAQKNWDSATTAYRRAASSKKLADPLQQYARQRHQAIKQLRRTPLQQIPDNPFK